jgi:hypothetical protein
MFVIVVILHGTRGRRESKRAIEHEQYHKTSVKVEETKICIESC